MRADKDVHAAIGKARTLRLDAPGKGNAKRLKGPSVLTLSDATMVVARGWSARALAIGGWLLERQ